VLGILSFVGFCFLTGIPAIITGHIARNRATKTPATYGGAGMALGGLIMGYCSLALIPVVAVLAGLMLPALAKAKARAQEINCVNNMKQIALAARLWSTDHNDVFPPDFLTMKNELNSTKILVCPSDPTRTRPEVSDWSTITKESITYEFVAPGIKDDSAAASKVVFRCPIHGHVAFGDGSVRQGRNGRPPPGY
jgi:type II secretory pathway pseudopilin PulG